MLVSLIMHLLFRLVNIHYFFFFGQHYFIIIIVWLQSKPRIFFWVNAGQVLGTNNYSDPRWASYKFWNLQFHTKKEAYYVIVDLSKKTHLSWPKQKKTHMIYTGPIWVGQFLNILLFFISKIYLSKSDKDVLYMSDYFQKNMQSQ